MVTLGYTTTFLVGVLGICFVGQRCFSDFSPMRVRSLTRVTFMGLQEHDTGLVTLTFVLADSQRVRFYSTESKFDMALLLDQLDGTIGERRREVSRADA